MKFGVVVFPGSNCDHDMIHVLSNVMEQEVVEIWHKNDHLEGFGPEDWIMLPGGFSYGDSLRSGAIASYSPIMKSVKEFADKGGNVFGVCNGFQILCESGLLPGTLLRNQAQKFICKNVHLKVENDSSKVTNQMSKGDVLKIPVAHAEGRYYCDDKTLDGLQTNNQILFRYSDEGGNVSKEANINGSRDSIAGICNKQGNVFGMMPHPERASEEVLGNADGRRMFESILQRTMAM